MILRFKICSKCKIEKELEAFSQKSRGKYDVSSICKMCFKQYYNDNKAALAEKQRAYNKDNAEKITARKQQYYQKIVIPKRIEAAKNEEKIKEQENKIKRKREYQKEYQRNYAKIHADKKREYRNNQYNEDYLFAISMRIRSLIGCSLRRRSYTKKSRTHEILGCDYKTFALHIEKQFVDGMGWDNKNKWHIDHKIPLASAQTEADVIRLNHYTNLQPLWAEDNLKKGAKFLTANVDKKP